LHRLDDGYLGIGRVGSTSTYNICYFFYFFLFLSFAGRCLFVWSRGGIEAGYNAVRTGCGKRFHLFRNLTQVILLDRPNGKLTVSSGQTPNVRKLTISFASILHPTNCIRTLVSLAIVSASERKQGGEAFGSNFISVLTSYPISILILSSNTRKRRRVEGGSAIIDQLLQDHPHNSTFPKVCCPYALCHHDRPSVDGQVVKVEKEVEERLTWDETKT
jgi:hypothetical protein